MLGRLPSRTVIAICLFVGVCTLFLRNIVYSNLQQPESPRPDTDLQHQDDTITLAYHERPPYYTTGDDGSLAGLCGKPAASAFKHSGLTYSIMKMPPKRQLSSIQSNSERICGVGWFKSPEREMFARFTNPLYQDQPTAVLIRADIADDFISSTTHDLFTSPDLTLLLKSGYSYGGFIDGKLKKHSPRTVTTTGTTQRMLDMIAKGQADYFFLPTDEAETLLTGTETPQLFRLLELPEMPHGDTRYIMCSKQVTENEIDALNKAMTAITTESDRLAVQKQ